MPKYAVWYMKPSFFSIGIIESVSNMKKKGVLPTKATLQNTHVLIRDIKAPHHEDVYNEMQAENWSPNGEANAMLKFKGIHHTSMSIGDIVVEYDTGTALMCVTVGWHQLD